MHCCSLLWELWRESQQVSWAAGRGWSKHFRTGFCKRRVLRLNSWAWQLALEGEGSKWLQPLRSPYALALLCSSSTECSSSVSSPQSLVVLASLKPPTSIFILCSHNFFKSLISSSLATGPLLLLSTSTWFSRSPLLPFTPISRLTSPLSSGACGLGKCWQHQGLLPALCTWFLPCKAGSSGRIGSTVHKEPVCQQGTNQQAGVQPVRVCRGLN